MKILFFLIAVGMMLPVASADMHIVDNITYNIDNGAHIKILAGQRATNVIVENATDSPANSVRFFINGSEIIFNTGTNKTLSRISLDNTHDILNYTGDGTDGYLKTTAKMLSAATNYTFQVDGINETFALSDGTKTVVFNYTWALTQHDFSIFSTVPVVVIITNAVKRAIIFTDETCLNTGLCSSKMGISQDGMQVGTVSSQNDYILVDSNKSIKLILTKPSFLALLNNPSLFQNIGTEGWILLLSIVLIMGIITAIYFITRRQYR